MADQDYGRLAAACACGEPHKVFASSGRVAKKCKTPKPSGASLAAYLARVRNEANYFKCEHCGADSHRPKSGKMAARGTGNKWCSWNCMLASNAKRKAAKQEKLKAQREKREQERRERDAAIANASVHRRTCIQCGDGFDADRKNQTLCSTRCKRLRARQLAKGTDWYRAIKRASRSRRKAMERAAVVEKFDPFEVLERDGWKCQICGCDTPKKLRGTFKSNAPELDHIVPLSKGGSHSRANTQCACRRCNGAKADGKPQGQIGLFSAPHQGGAGA